MSEEKPNKFLQNKNGELFLDCKQLSKRKGFRRVTQDQLDEQFERMEDIAVEPEPRTATETISDDPTMAEHVTDGWE